MQINAVNSAYTSRLQSRMIPSNYSQVNDTGQSFKLHQYQIELQLRFLECDERHGMYE